jgi:hypothetical protein
VSTMAEVYEWVRRRSGKEVTARLLDCGTSGAIVMVEIDGDPHPDRHFAHAVDARRFVRQ